MLNLETKVLLNLLLEQTKENNNLEQIINEIIDDPGDGSSPSPLLEHSGKTPLYETRINNLIREIEKRDKWLEQRKIEVADLHKKLEEKNELLKHKESVINELKGKDKEL